MRSSSSLDGVQQRQLELDLVQRQRRAQLVAGVVDEPPLALERLLEAAEHRVQGLAQAPELVVGLRDRQALSRLARDLGCAPAHRVDRAAARAAVIQ